MFPAVFRELLARQFSSLAVRNYRLYFTGQLVSLVGTWMQRIGEAWLVLKLTDSPLALGTVTTLQFLPITILTLFGGVFADRMPKRRMLIITQWASLAQAMVMAVLVSTGVVELWHVYLLALWLGIVNALDGPVRQSFVVELVGREQLTNAVALNSSIFNMARIVGPAVGGILIALVGMSAAFYLNAFSYFAVLAAYMMMRPSEFRAVPMPAKGGVLRQVWAGIMYSVRTPRVLFLFILLAFIGTFGYNFTVIIPLVAEYILEVGPGRFGFLTSCMGVGSLAAALALAANGKPSLRMMLIAAVSFSVLLGTLALSPWFTVTALLLVVLGIGSVTFSTTINTIIQMTVPDELRGRVMSIYFLLFAGSTPLGGYVTGWLAEEYSVRTTLFALAAVCGTGVLVALAYGARHTAEIARAGIAYPGGAVHGAAAAPASPTTQ